MKALISGIALLTLAGCASVPFREPISTSWGYEGIVESGPVSGMKLVAIWPSLDTCVARRDEGRKAQGQRHEWSIAENCRPMMVTPDGEFWAFSFAGPPAGIFGVAYNREAEIRAACSKLRWSVRGRTSDCVKIGVRYVDDQ